jgi:hypothetical protein
VYTWGSGFHGQLAQESNTMSITPQLVTFLADRHLVVSSLTCGSHHNAIITQEGELYTWGSNKNLALGHEISEDEVDYTPFPGICSGFGAIVDRIGRGMPRSVACGKQFTIVATYAYEGPQEDVAKKLMEEIKLREEEEELRQEEERREEAQQRKRDQKDEETQHELEYLTSKRLCSLDPDCPGFEYHAFKPNICKNCGYSNAYHNVVPDDSNSVTEAGPALPSSILDKNMGGKKQR